MVQGMFIMADGTTTKFYEGDVSKATDFLQDRLKNDRKNPLAGRKPVHG
jgi:hypothetical protein